MEQNIFIQRNGKKILRGDTVRIPEAVIRRFNVKKVSFIYNISPPVYLHIIKIDIKHVFFCKHNAYKHIQPGISEKISIY